ncbi:MAG: PAS domain S-box protein [Gracilimonas sp.]|uniref:sensor histidine kinase n=1 Tax=Gracilimonas sp. TaxID=1974203 RepID=UPI003750CB6B|nr:PAS domain S-box protein [Gracilimonas sp.]
MLEYIFRDEKAIGSKPAILLSVSRTSDRRLIKKNIPAHYAVIEETDTSPAELKYDLCITDLHSFKKYRKEFLEIKRRARPVFSPLMLLIENSKALKYDPETWTQVDDIIEVSMPMKMLNIRIENQMRSRTNSLKIARQNKILHILEKAINSTDVGIIITDAQEKDNPIIFSNDGFTKLTGYSREEILGNNCRFLQQDNRDQDAARHIRQLIQNGETGRSIIQNYKKDGTPFWNELSIAPVKDSEGEVSHFIGIQNDVTQLVEIQKALKDEKDVLRLVMENSTDLISRHSLNGTYLYVTPSCQELMGYTPDELMGRNAFDFMHPDDRKRVNEAHKVLYHNPADTTTVTTTFRKRTKSGEYIWVETVSHASINADNNPLIEIQANTRDISTRKKYEDDLKDALEEKNVLLQEIHHRVKNNLAVISGLLQVQQFSSDNEYLNKILGNSISRIKSMALIHEKLYRSKSLSHLEFREYIEDLVSSIKKTQDHSDKINIHVDCDDIVLNVNQAVPCALILNEAISNAIEHAFVGKKEKGTIWVSFKEHNNELHVSIRDDGIGMPKNVLGTKQASMGLTIIQTLIKQLSAEKEIKNNYGTEILFSFVRQDVKGAHSRFM